MARASDIIGGKYRLIHPLGVGGMGTVWRCEHTQLKLQMAIKLLDARGPAADRSVQRFRREAQIAASIRHRNIVYISDFGTEGGAPYLVMELLAGVPLSERLVVSDPLSVGAFLRLIEQTLQGLAAVHEAGVVHRDMKPENIFLVRDGAVTYPKLLDFGVSRSTERGQGHTITREGIVMGTPEYVAPEQARGKMADARSDIYSLGVVIYEALTGRLPFHADNAADLIVAVLNADPIPLVSLRPDLGQLISDIVGKAMARKPEDRYQTAEELRQALVSFLEHTPDVDKRWLPKRFVAPQAPTHETPQSLNAPPLVSTIPPKKETHISDSTAIAVTGVLSRSGKRIAAVSVAALGALIALLVFAMLSGEKPRPAAKAAEPSQEVPLPEPVVTKSEAAPVRQVSVELFGLPEGAEVLADGTTITGPIAYFTRGSGLHTVEVRAPGKQPWRVVHDATSDGRYALSLESAPDAEEKRTRRREKSEPEAVPKAKAPAKPKSSLVRTPDF